MLELEQHTEKMQAKACMHAHRGLWEQVAVRLNRAGWQQPNAILTSKLRFGTTGFSWLAEVVTSIPDSQVLGSLPFYWSAISAYRSGRYRTLH